MNSSVGSPSQRNSSWPRSGCSAAMTAPAAPSAACSAPFGWSIHHVLRNHSDGNRCTVALLVAAVGDGDADVHVVGSALGVLDVDVDVAIVVEDAGVEQLVLQLEPASSAVRRDEIGVRELVQRVPVAVLQVRARRRGVEVEVVLLHVLAVIALGVRQPEHPLLQDRIDPVPERDRRSTSAGGRRRSRRFRPRPTCRRASGPGRG